jgi:hypothetical protein
MQVLTRRFLYPILLLVSIPAALAAQAPARSLEELRSRPKAATGESVQVIDSAGTSIKGKIAEITTNSLTLTVDGAPRIVNESLIKEIRYRPKDSLWNGTLIGIIAGLGVGWTMVATTCGDDTECAFYAGVAFIPVSIGGGAAAGAIIDARMRRTEIIFKNPTVARSGRLTISPILTKSNKGIRFAFSF